MIVRSLVLFALHFCMICFPRYFYLRFRLRARNHIYRCTAQVDVYLDLASPDSAAAWKTTWEVVSEHGFRTEFEFHILPILQNKIVFDAAKVGLSGTKKKQGQ